MPEVNVIASLFANAALAVPKSLFLAPLDRIKLLLQLRPGIPELSQSNNYTGISELVKGIYREQGLLSFWRGAFPAILSAAIRKSTVFYINYHMTTKVNERDNQFTNYLIISLILFGGPGLIITHPLDTIRAKLAVDCGRSQKERKYRNMNECVNEIWKVDGFKGFYRGVWLMFPRAFLHSQTLFRMNSLMGNFANSNNIVLGLIPAMLINITPLLIYYPIDTVMRRMMIQSGKPGKTSKSKENKFKNSFACAYKMLRKEGLRSFYRGSLFEVTRTILLSLLGTWYRFTIISDKFKE